MQAAVEETGEMKNVRLEMLQIIFTALADTKSLVLLRSWCLVRTLIMLFGGLLELLDSCRLLRHKYAAVTAE